MPSLDHYFFTYCKLKIYLRYHVSSTKAFSCILVVLDERGVFACFEYTIQQSAKHLRGARRMRRFFTICSAPIYVRMRDCTRYTWYISNVHIHIMGLTARSLQFAAGIRGWFGSSFSISLNNHICICDALCAVFLVADSANARIGRMNHRFLWFAAVVSSCFSPLPVFVDAEGVTIIYQGARIQQQ